MTHEALVKSHMERLGIDRAEAEQLIIDDNNVDKMTSTKEINSDISSEQVKIIKQATSTKSKKHTAYNFSTRERKKDVVKSDFIKALSKFVSSMAENVMIVKEEREISFTINNDSYSITLTKHRK